MHLALGPGFWKKACCKLWLDREAQLGLSLRLSWFPSLGPDPFAKIIEPLRTSVATWALLSVTSVLGWTRGIFMGTQRGQSTFRGGFVWQTRHFHRKEQDTGGTEMTILPRMRSTSTLSSSPTCGSSKGFRWTACRRGYQKQISQCRLTRPSSNPTIHGETFLMPRRLRNGLLGSM